MPLTICFYEDQKYSDFHPLSHLRPVSTLRVGMVPLFLRARRYFADASICLAVRTSISPLVAEQHREIAVNIVKRANSSDVLFLNGRVRDYGNLSDCVNSASVTTRFISGEEVIGVLFKFGSIRNLPAVAMPNHYVDDYEKNKSTIATKETTATLYHHAWELLPDISEEISADFKHLRQHNNIQTPKDLPGVFITNREQVSIAASATVQPCVVIDASAGPVYIGDNSRIESHVAIYGPAYIGPDCVILQGKISGSSIGTVSRVGGEVEASIVHSHVNKYHAGFIGHSYVCPWVNFGAMTTNSDLKNNYSPIKLMVGGKAIDSGALKVGSFIGDHTKFGIGTLLNTGINIGVCCNIFGGTLVTDKEVQSFRWGNTSLWKNYDLEKALETARKAVERRGLKLSEHHANALTGVFKGVKDEQGICIL